MKTITMLFLLFTSSTYADSLKFSYKDRVRVKKSECDERCKFYKLDSKDPKCFVQGYNRGGYKNDTYIYEVNCKDANTLLDYTGDQIERVK